MIRLLRGMNRLNVPFYCLHVLGSRVRAEAEVESLSGVDGSDFYKYHDFPC